MGLSVVYGLRDDVNFTCVRKSDPGKWENMAQKRPNLVDKRPFRLKGIPVEGEMISSRGNSDFEAFLPSSSPPDTNLQGGALMIIIQGGRFYARFGALNSGGVPNLLRLYAKEESSKKDYSLSGANFFIFLVLIKVAIFDSWKYLLFDNVL